MPAELKPVYLFSGTDRPKIEEAIRRLRARVGEVGIETFSAISASGADVVAACNAPGLFTAELRAVVVTGVEAWKTPDVGPVRAYLADPAPGTVLTLVAGSVKRDSVLAKACAKVGEVHFYDLSKSKLPAWVGQRFSDLGVAADREASRLLVEIVGEDVVELDAEIRKLATWAADESVDTAAVEALAAGRAEVPIFGLTDAWGRRKSGQALAAGEAILERAAGSRSSEITRLVGRLASHVDRVRECRALAESGATARQVASRLKRNQYYVDKLLAQAENFTADELDDALVRLAELDVALKGGSRLPADLELDRALVDTTQPPAQSAERPA